MMKLLTICSLLFINLEAVAQLAIIQDTDGYTNVRADKKGQSDIKFKMLHGQVFSYYGDGYFDENEWIEVKLGDNTFDDRCYVQGGHGGFMHRSRILPIEDIKTKLKGSVSQLEKGQRLKFSKGDINVLIHINNISGAPGQKSSCWFGTDGGVGTLGNEFEKISIQVKEEEIIIPKVDLVSLYNIDLSGVQVYLQQDLILIRSSTNAAAGYYEVVWVIKDGKYQRRYLDREL